MAIKALGRSNHEKKVFERRVQSIQNKKLYLDKLLWEKLSFKDFGAEMGLLRAQMAQMGQLGAQMGLL